MGMIHTSDSLTVRQVIFPTLVSQEDNKILSQNVSEEQAEAFLMRAVALVQRVSDNREGVVASEGESLPHLPHSHSFGETHDRRRHEFGDGHEAGADRWIPREYGDSGQSVVDVVESLVEELAHPLGDERCADEGDEHTD